ncbi:hypothetical protein FGADI_7249 [Fusarium gaditjirri]|uniref:Uncharacterized protein n=1 Tax=Fusarium gaditjirri TaxID=282569 RepID=A0A8H4T5P4_9HYPO|nr:hypothetical protein FGADI_7249 [Fusarium gaditjirri]
MAAIVEDSLDSLLTGDLSDFTQRRAAILEPAYKSYLISTDFCQDSPRPSSTYLLPSSEVIVLISRCPETEAATDLHITKLSDAFADNFIGYCPEEKCVVFKGERGLIDDFIDFTESVAGDREVTVILKAPEQIRLPLGGLEHGLKYEEFVSRVEVLECALWIGNSPSGMYSYSHHESKDKALQHWGDRSVQRKCYSIYPTPPSLVPDTPDRASISTISLKPCRSVNAHILTLFKEQEEGGIRFTKLATGPELPEPVTSNRAPTPDYISMTGDNSLILEGLSNINSTNIRSPITGASSPLSDPPPSPLVHTPSSPLSEPPSDIDEISLHNWDDIHALSSSSSEGGETPPSLREWE